MARPDGPRNSTAPVPEFDYARHQTATGDGDVQSHDAVHRDWNRVPYHRQYGDGPGNKHRQTDGERSSARPARCIRLLVDRGLQPHADRIDGVTLYDLGAASHLHRSRRKTARYAGSTRTEFDAISNQRRDRGAGNPLRNQAV